MTTEPTGAKRSAHFPDEYGTSGGPDALLPWSFVEERLREAINYWLATIGPNNRPHVRPVDGVWVENALIFGGSPETRWVRNLQRNPATTVSIGGTTEAVILEGEAHLVTDPAHPLAEPSNRASFEKYPQYHPDGKLPEFLPFWLFRPTRIYAWTLAEFATSATRWDLPKP